MVYLKENGTVISQTSSGANGDFSFQNVNIRSDRDYILSIPSKSGIGNGPEVGFDGVDAPVDKSNLSRFITMSVSPHAKDMNLYYPHNSYPTVSDTFSLVLDQNTFRKHFPNGTYEIVAGNSPSYPPPGNNFIGAIHNYWMGWWHYTLDRTINGSHIITQDSIYASWGGTVTDTIPW